MASAFHDFCMNFKLCMFSSLFDIGSTRQPWDHEAGHCESVIDVLGASFSATCSQVLRLDHLMGIGPQNKKFDNFQIFFEIQLHNGSNFKAMPSPAPRAKIGRGFHLGKVGT